MFSVITKSIELYVGKISKENLQDHLASPVVSTGMGYFTQMLENENPSASLVSPSYSNPYLTAGSHGPPMYYGFMPTMMSQPPLQQYFPYYTPPVVPTITQRYR